MRLVHPAILCVCFCAQLAPAPSAARFPHLRRAQARLDALDRSVRLRHHHRAPAGWYAPAQTTAAAAAAEEDLFDTYGELAEDNDEVGKTKDEEDNADFDDDDEPGKLFEEIIDDDYDDVQAEEPTEKPTTRATPVYTPQSQLSQMKWDRFGTQEKVTQERNRHMNALTSSQQLSLGVSAANQHFRRVQQQSMCKIPVPKVISLQILHPNPRVTYIPTCTVLHRCAEDTGCCKNHGETCKYKTRETVNLYVYSKFLDQSELRVEKLTFHNDTECECKKSTNDTDYDTNSSAPNPNEITYKSSGKIYHGKPESYTKIRCNCPEEFVPKVGFSRNCLCECDGGDEGCIRMQKGEEHLSLKDRRCILEGNCSPPHCEYGLYKKNQGRCAKISERENVFRKIWNNMNAVKSD